ncbi:hypothetical protein KBD49_12740 [Myxococcota bacterium]|nr:hypothetical protein [Myxococcota bacterium]
MPWDTDRRFRKWPLWLLVVGQAGCAFGPGDPWGRLEASLSLRMVPSSGRLDPEGHLATALDYRVRLDRLVVRGGLMEVSGSSDTGGTAAVAFDPAHPPEGYTLCHGGHCHAADGRLVPYDEVIAELDGGATGSGDRTWLAIPWDVEEVEVPVGGSAGVDLGPCPGDCTMPEGTLTRASVRLDGILLEGVVFDARTGSGRRIPEEGVPFRGTVTGELQVQEALSEAVGPGHPLRVRLAATLSLADALFDPVDFAALSRSGEVLVLGSAETAIREALAAGTVLQLDVER